MQKKWIDENGQRWKMLTINGATRRYKDDPEHEDIQLEMNEISRDRKEFKSFFWLGLCIYFFYSFALLYVLFLCVSWIFSGTNQGVIAIIVSAAYLAAIFTMYIGRVEARVNRMEVHALTIHAEILKIQDKFEAKR